MRLWWQTNQVQVKNPILKILLYDVDLIEREVTPLAVYAIVQALHTMYNIDFNDNFLLKWLVEVQKAPTAITLDKQ